MRNGGTWGAVLVCLGLWACGAGTTARDDGTPPDAVPPADLGDPGPADLANADLATADQDDPGGTGDPGEPADTRQDAPDRAPDAAEDAPPPDEAPDDTAPDTLDAPDAPDVPPPPDGPWAALCRLDCADDAACGTGGRCLTFTVSKQKFCALPCGEGKACPDGFQCATVKEQDLCVPRGSDCAWATLGIECNRLDLQGICKNQAPECTAGTSGRGTCTRACAADADCPAPYRDCRASLADPDRRLCRGVWESGPEGCGRTRVGPGGLSFPCDGAGECPDGLACAAPASGLAFCTRACGTADECPADGVEPPACGPVTDLAAPAQACLSRACACRETRDTLYDRALAALGLTRCTAIFPRAFLAIWPTSLKLDPWRTRRYHEIHDDPGRALVQTRRTTEALRAPVSVALREAAALLDAPFDPGTPPDAQDLLGAVAGFITAAGGTPDPSALAPSLAAVPAPLAKRLAPVVAAMTEVVTARAAWVQAIGGEATAQMLFDGAHGWAVVPRNLSPLFANVPWVQAALRVDRTPLYRAAARLAAAIEAGDATEGGWAALAGTAVPSIRIETPAGAILFREPGDDLYDAATPGVGTGPLALVVDMGGNDTYRIPAGATSTLANPVSVLLDLGGDDDYGYASQDTPADPHLLPADEDKRYVPTAGPDQDNGPVSLSDRSRQGAGRLGVGMLFDFGGGRDRYRSLRLSQGCGVLGVGVVRDDGGDDTWRAEAASQGVGMFGIGILDDGGGTDAYEGFHLVQGAAYAAGVGLLRDRGGNDTYTAVPGDATLGGYPLYFSPQNPGKSNSSMAQGCGFGRRADADGAYMSGGFGLLVDDGGIDAYTADIFAQGVGYWFGTGVLWDRDGADTYEGRWYAQGAAAHFATGVLLDDAGDDRYNPTFPGLNACLGLGHDFSLGILADGGGDDRYRAPSLSVGAGNDNGIGIFLDAAGNDAYASTATNTFGWGSVIDLQAGDPREAFASLGVFLDGGGTDAYARPDLPGGPIPIADAGAWIQRQDAGTKPRAQGAGVDADGLPPGL